MIWDSALPVCFKILQVMRKHIVNCDCMKLMASMPDRSVDFILTDIPYGEVNASEQGHPCNITNLNKGKADELTFALEEFVPEICRISRNSCLIFCSAEQFSFLRMFLKKRNGTVRTLVWEKTNPCPLHGQRMYVSGVELAVWFRHKGNATFNAFCKNTVFRHPIGSSRLHPTEKNHKLLEELILDNTNPGDLVFDPCAGSGSTLLVAKQLGRRYFGCELDKDFCDKANDRLEKIIDS